MGLILWTYFPKKGRFLIKLFLIKEDAVTKFSDWTSNSEKNHCARLF